MKSSKFLTVLCTTAILFSHSAMFISPVATAEDADIPVIACFGDHTEVNDPLYYYYVFDTETTNKTNTLSDLDYYYFTGQIYLSITEDYPDQLNCLQGLKHMFCDWAPQGYFIWNEEKTLSITDAQRICSAVTKNIECTASLVYCTKRPCNVKGDVDGDDSVTTKDAKRLLDDVVFYLTFPSYKEYEFPKHLNPTADINNDGTVNISDAKFILDYSVANNLAKLNVGWNEITNHDIF